MSDTQNGLRRRSLLQKILGGSLLGAAGLTGLFTRSAAAAEPPVTSVVLRNVGIAVANLEKSTKFYVDAFGFNADAKPAKIGAFLSGLMEVENLDMTIQFLDSGGTTRLELLHFANPKPTGDGNRRPINVRGLSHVQLRVPDVKAAMDKVTKAGGKVLENTLLKDKDGKILAVFVTDLDGTRLELVP
jgi:catechol 2,3-dioxygenase-like lactoylglutathione lyase family enzyme